MFYGTCAAPFHTYLGAVHSKASMRRK